MVLRDVQPTGLAGGSWGLEVELGLIEEVSVEASFANVDLTGFLGVSISEDVGEEDGGEALYSETFVWGWNAPRVYQTPAANYMILTSIHCDQASEWPNKDEVYFTFSIDGGPVYRYPTEGQFSMDGGDTWNAGRSIYFNNQVTVELWDHDDANSDSLGSTTYTVSNFQASVQVSGSTGKYTLQSVLNPIYLKWPTVNRINGVDTSKAGPGSCLFNGNSYLFWCGETNSSIFYSGTDSPNSWPNGTVINNSASTMWNPTAIDFNGELFVFWKDNSSRVNWSASTTATGPAPWPNGQALPNETTFSTPTPCVFNGTLYLFWNTNDDHNRIIYSTWNPSSRTWAANKPINSSDATGTQLAACVFNNQLYLIWRRNDDRKMYFSASSNNSWPTGKTINSGETTLQGPAACVYEGNLIVFFISNDAAQLLLWTASANGTSWPSNTIVNNSKGTTSWPPAATVYSGDLYVFFTQPGKEICYAASQPV